MTLEKEDRLVGEIRQIERDKRAAIQKIVDARVAGRRDDAAIRELSRLSERKLELTRPALSGKAA
jgi:hypothetical protein